MAWRVVERGLKRLVFAFEEAMVVLVSPMGVSGSANKGCLFLSGHDPSYVLMNILAFNTYRLLNITVQLSNSL